MLKHYRDWALSRTRSMGKILHQKATNKLQRHELRPSFFAATLALRHCVSKSSLQHTQCPNTLMSLVYT